MNRTRRLLPVAILAALGAAPVACSRRVGGEKDADRSVRGGAPRAIAPAREWRGNNCYVHRVKICTPTPTAPNGDGPTSEPGAIAYTSAWSAQEPEADATLDWIVNTSDFVTFVDWYMQETGQ